MVTDEDFLRCLRVRELTTDGAELRLQNRTVAVPPPLRRALARRDGERLALLTVSRPEPVVGEDLVPVGP